MSEEHVERRLAAILAADVVGYSRLMETNEEQTLSSLRQHRREFFDPTVARHGGRIFKVMGDGFLIEFGRTWSASPGNSASPMLSRAACARSGTGSGSKPN